MRKFYVVIHILLIASLLAGCSKKEEVQEFLMKYRYSTVAEFQEALIKLDSLIMLHEVMAYHDTLPNGEPDPYGEATPLTQFVGYIFGLVEVNDLEAAVYEMYRFNGHPFSLISYLMKAQMAGNISPQTMVQILMHIPLPPIPVVNFVPPRIPIPNPSPPPPATCQCDPKVKILVTWSYKPACGNYTKEISGYAANNTLTNMTTGTWFQLDGEVEGCNCGGTWTNTVTTTSTSYGYSNPPGNKVGLTSYSSGSFTVTFTYTCGCGCGKSDTKTFTITF